MTRVLRGEIGAAPKQIQTAAVTTAAEVVVDKTATFDSRTLTLKGNGKQEIAELRVPISGATLELSAAVVYQLKNAQTTRKAVILFDFVDTVGEKIEDVAGIGMAAAFKQHFRYLNANSKSIDDAAQ